MNELLTVNCEKHFGDEATGLSYFLLFIYFAHLLCSNTSTSAKHGSWASAKALRCDAPHMRQGTLNLKTLIKVPMLMAS